MAEFGQYESLVLIKPPYPASGSAEWWQLRKSVEGLIARDSRRAGTTYTDAEFRRSEAARLTSLGDEDAQIDYERNGLTREQWLYKWNPDALDGLKLSPAQMTAMLRETLRRF